MAKKVRLLSTMPEYPIKEVRTIIAAATVETNTGQVVSKLGILLLRLTDQLCPVTDSDDIRLGEHVEPDQNGAD